MSKYIQSKKATVNIKKKDNKNFLYCLSYARKPVVKDAQRPSHYIKDLNNFDISGMKFPVTLNQIAEFEQHNPDFSMNVYKLDKKVDKEINLIPLYTTLEQTESITQICYRSEPAGNLTISSSAIWVVSYSNKRLLEIKCTLVNIA